MAIEYKTVKDKLEKTPLTETELSIINTVEKYIDTEITKQFKCDDVRINLRIPDFSYEISLTAQRDIPAFRQNLMKKELETRYEKAGWIVTKDYNDDVPDYWVLTGKK